MQYVKVTGNTHAEALKKLRDSYGEDAIIFGEKTIPAKSMFSWITNKKYFLIEAAIKEKKSSNSTKNNLLLKNIISSKNEPNANAFSKPPNVMSVSSNPVPKENEKFLKEVKQKINYQNSNLSNSASQDEIAKIKEDIQFIKENISNLSYPSKSSTENIFQKLKKYLLKQDFTNEWSDQFIKNLKENIPQNEWNHPKNIYAKSAELMKTHIRTSPHLGKKRIIVLIGSTGVGKTTTIAKLAARLKLEKSHSISLVTLDNYRIAATEQLKVYANILDVPVHVCKETKKLKNIFAEDNSDFILIDTAGLSHKNQKFLDRQKNFFDELEHEVEKHLVISATSKPEDTYEIVASYDLLKFERIIISKIDETNRYGHLVEIANKWHKPFSFFSIGQNVPDDCMEGNAEFLTRKILRSFERNIQKDHTDP